MGRKAGFVEDRQPRIMVHHGGDTRQRVGQAALPGAPARRDASQPPKLGLLDARPHRDDPVGGVTVATAGGRGREAIQLEVGVGVDQTRQDQVPVQGHPVTGRSASPFRSIDARTAQAQRRPPRPVPRRRGDSRPHQLDLGHLTTSHPVGPDASPDTRLQASAAQGRAPVLDSGWHGGAPARILPGRDARPRDSW